MPQSFMHQPFAQTNFFLCLPCNRVHLFISYTATCVSLLQFHRENKHIISPLISYLVRELYLGDGVGCFSLLKRWVVTPLFVEHHFSNLLWPLAGDVRKLVTCLFISRPLSHIFVATVFILEVKLRRPVCKFQASLTKLGAFFAGGGTV